MPLRITLFLSLCFCLLGSIGTLTSQSSNLESLEVSILTCGTGEDLYTLFGHSALRIRDTLRGRDVVYNWGTFDYGEPGLKGIMVFMLKFLRGQLPYILDDSSYKSFEYAYNYEGRSVVQQTLDMDTDQKKVLLNALVVNLQKENRTYKYDFYFDNCVTRPRDILEKVYGGVSYPDLNLPPVTYRDLLHENLSESPWTELGMDLVLGTLSDKVADERGQMFLPAYFKNYMDGAQSGGQKLIVAEKELLPQIKEDKMGFFSPSLLFWSLFILELVGAFLFYISGDKGFLKYLDIPWMMALGVSSIILLLLWFATDHMVCRNNYNLLWAGPWTWLYWKKETPQRISLWLTVISSALVLLCWQMIPQALPSLIIPICLVNILKGTRLLGLFRKLDKPLLRFAIFIVILGYQSPQITAQKIDGITLVSPPREFASDPMPPLVEVHADWVALVPYGFSRIGEPEVRYGSDGQWWGEKVGGIEKSIQYAKANNLKVMIKPQVWLHGMWVGDVDHKSDEAWKRWEDTYRDYIMQFVDLAIKYDIEMICIGTEYRNAVKKREAFWRELIKDIRGVYDGMLTYSANWDDYESLPFWDALDFIGISAYFPLSDMDTPPTLLLTYRWRKHVKKLEKYSQKIGKKILFTEYGYLSVDGAAGKTWQLEKKMDDLAVNQQAQANGFDALLNSFWDTDFWAGGFLWKWFPENYGRQNKLAKEYTPKDKIAAGVLAKWYKKAGS